MLPSPIAIVGGGFLGCEVARTLEGAVTVTTRSGKWRDGERPPHVRMAALDVVRSGDDVLRETLRGARGVIVCYARGPAQDRRALYLDGGRRLAAALAELGPRRVVYVSSTAALPDVDGELDESCAALPDSERGRIQREAEGLYMEACADAGIPWVVLRLAGLYGPGRDIGRIYRRRGDDPLPGDGMTATNLIHRTDAVAAVGAALMLPSHTSALVHVCDDDHCSRRHMYAAAARERGEPAPTWELDPAPDAGIRGKRVSNARMKELLGVRLQHPRHS